MDKEKAASREWSKTIPKVRLRAMKKKAWIKAKAEGKMWVRGFKTPEANTRYTATYIAKHREKERARKKAYTAKNKERIAQYKKEYREKQLKAIRDRILKADKYIAGPGKIKPLDDIAKKTFYKLQWERQQRRKAKK